jgi:hypothetical protein
LNVLLDSVWTADEQMADSACVFPLGKNLMYYYGAGKQRLIGTFENIIV